MVTPPTEPPNWADLLGRSFQQIVFSRSGSADLVQQIRRPFSSALPVKCLYSSRISRTALSRPSDVRCTSVSACSICDIQHSTARSTPTAISLAMASTRSAGIAVVAKNLPAFLNLRDEAPFQGEGPPDPPPSLPLEFDHDCSSTDSITSSALLPSALPARVPACDARIAAPAWL